MTSPTFDSPDGPNGVGPSSEVQAAANRADVKTVVEKAFMGEPT